MKNNNIKRFVLFLIILSIACTLSCVNAADHDSDCCEIIGDSASGEIYVSPDASDEAGTGSVQNPYKSIGWAVNNSKDNSTIHLNDGAYVGDANRNIKIDKAITIIGKSKQNTIINAEFSGRVFNLTSTGRLTLIDVTLMNGYINGSGGLIYSNGGDINIQNCIMKNSSAFLSGGVIYNNLGSLNVEDSCFTNNSARDYAGVMYTMGKTSIKNTEFTENVLTSQEAIGACIVAGGTLDLDGCLFYKCFTTYSAAALLNLGNATVNNCRFERLTTNYTAGGISNHKYMIINNSYFGFNDVRYYAAAILAPPSGQHVITEVYNTIFEKNHAGYLAAVSNNYKNTELYMQNCAIINNYIKLNERYGDIGLDDNATIQYCWWGQNEINPYYYSPHSSEINPEKINASRWLIMTFTANDGAVYRNEVNQLTVSLKNYFDNNTKEIHEYECEFDLPLDVTLYTDEGTIATKKLVNGVATFDYKPQDKTEAVYAKLNNQILKIEDFQIRKTAIIADDVEKYYGSSTKLAITLIGDNNATIANEELNVTVGGIPSIIKTDANGIAKLTLKDTPKSYGVNITFNGTNYIGSSKAVKVKIVKPTIKASKLTVHKKGNFVVTFKDAHNKAIKNVKVKFKIKGKTYTRTTNSKGQAKLTINLKAGKKYTVKVGFKSTSVYGTTTLTKKIKVIK